MHEPGALGGGRGDVGRGGNHWAARPIVQSASLQRGQARSAQLCLHVAQLLAAAQGGTLRVEEVDDLRSRIVLTFEVVRRGLHARALHTRGDVMASDTLASAIRRENRSGHLLRRDGCGPATRGTRTGVLADARCAGRQIDVDSIRISPAHRDAVLHEVLTTTTVASLMKPAEGYVCFQPETLVAELVQATTNAGGQDVFPIIGDAARLRGIVTASEIFLVASQPETCAWLVAADVMLSPTSLRPEDHLRRATEIMVRSGLRELPVLDAKGRLVGFLDEADIAHSYVEASARSERAGE